MPLTVDCADRIMRLRLAADADNGTIDAATLRAVYEQLDRYEHDMALRVALIESDGAHFGRAALDAMGPAFRRPSVSKHVIAAIQGDCLGELFTLVCATASLRLATAVTRLGFGDGPVSGEPLLSRSRLGGNAWHAPVMWLALSGETIGAEQAMKMGLLARVVSADKLKAEAEKLAAWLAELLPVALLTDRRDAELSRDLAFDDGIFLLYADYVMSYHQPTSWDETWGLHAKYKDRH
jgi:enoyl-CoA hydratase/carnithine racemase